MTKKAIAATETLRRQLMELDNLQHSRDWMIANAGALRIGVTIKGAGPSGSDLEHHEFGRHMRAHLRGIMDQIVEGQRALCDATLARLRESMDPDFDEVGPANRPVEPL